MEKVERVRLDEVIQNAPKGAAFLETVEQAARGMKEQLDAVRDLPADNADFITVRTSISHLCHWSQSRDTEAAALSGLGVSDWSALPFEIIHFPPLPIG